MQRHAIVWGFVIAASSSAAFAQQTLKFDNTTPPVTIPLQDSTTLQFTDDGNATATCLLGDDGRCAGLPALSCPAAPAVSIAATAFSSPPVSPGVYPPGTAFSLTATVDNADVCVREVDAGTPADTGWSGGIASGFGVAAPVVLTLPGSTYRFSMRCYNADGSSTSSTITLATSDVSPGCQGVPVGAPGFGVDARWDELTDVPTNSAGTTTLLPFPNTGSLVGNLVIPKGRWVSLRFDVPADPAAFTGLSKFFDWIPAPLGGEANVAATYVTVSQCRGDFRAPATGNAPAGDATYALGCRNLRPVNSTIAIRYEPVAATTASTGTVCNLTRGGTYYFNMILANPYDGGGIVPGETSCSDPTAPQCGLGIRAR